MIYLASDKTGFAMKEEIKEYLLNRGYKVKDLGPEKSKEVDYVDMAQQVAYNVSAEFNNRGVLFSVTGFGMCIAANKIKKISAAVVHNEELAEETRMEDNSNVLCIPVNYVGLELAKRIVGTWLSTSFSGVDYFVKGVKKIRALEEGD